MPERREVSNKDQRREGKSQKLPLSVYGVIYLSGKKERRSALAATSHVYVCIVEALPSAH